MSSGNLTGYWSSMKVAWGNASKWNWCLTECHLFHPNSSFKTSNFSKSLDAFRIFQPQSHRMQWQSIFWWHLSRCSEISQKVSLVGLNFDLCQGESTPFLLSMIISPIKQGNPYHGYKNTLGFFDHTGNLCGTLESKPVIWNNLRTKDLDHPSRSFAQDWILHIRHQR